MSTKASTGSLLSETSPKDITSKKNRIKFKLKIALNRIVSNWFILLLYSTLVIIPIIWFKNLSIGEYCFGMTMEQAGQFGDRFGAATSLFGGLTIILLMISIHLQRQEIAEGKKEFKAQNKTLRLQRFDNSFFNMLTLFTTVSEKINLTRFKETNSTISSMITAFVDTNSNDIKDWLSSKNETLIIR